MATLSLAIARPFARTLKFFGCLQNQEKHVLRFVTSSNSMLVQSSINSRHFSSLRTRILKRPTQSAPQAIEQSLVPIEDLAAKDKTEVQSKLYFEATREDIQPEIEKFIPLTRHELVQRLLKESKLFSPSEISQMEKFSVSLDACISRRFYVQLEEMKLLYDIMDPDKDTIQTREVPMKELLDNEYWFLQKLEMLLFKANYYKIQRSEIFKLLKSHDTLEGVHVTVDPKQYSTLRIWTRGLSEGDISTMQKLKSRMKGLISRNGRGPSTFKYYTRVFVAVRSKKSRKLHLKVFKDVPCDKLEYLVPDGKIEMSKFDKGFLISSVFLGTIAITAKLLTVAANLKLDFGLIGLGVAGIIGARGWVGYKNKRNKYLVNLSRTLYFKTVANNRGVLTLLTDRAEDEEFKEALLAYLFLLSPPNRRGVPGVAYTPDPPQYHTQESLQKHIQQWLSDSFGFKVTFDVNDAVMMLDNMGLLVRHGDDTLSVVPIDVAMDTLPDPTYQWHTVGVFKDSEVAEEKNNKNTRSRNDDLRHYPGWH